MDRHWYTDLAPVFQGPIYRSGQLPGRGTSRDSTTDVEEPPTIPCDIPTLQHAYQRIEPKNDMALTVYERQYLLEEIRRRKEEYRSYTMHQKLLEGDVACREEERRYMDNIAREQVRTGVSMHAVHKCFVDARPECRDTSGSLSRDR